LPASQPTRRLQGTPLPLFHLFSALFFLALAQLRSLFTTLIFNIFVSPTPWSTYYSLSSAGKMRQAANRPVRLAADLVALRL